MHWSPGIEFDYDNDGSIDYFSFLTANYPPGNWGVEDGVYMLINDVFNPNREYKYFQTDGHKFEFCPELIDLNKDGLYEIIAGNSNSHNTGNGTSPDQIAPRIHSFDLNGSMTIADLFSEPRGTHDFAVGDVDNDTDILYWEYTLTNGTNITLDLWESEYYSKPILFLNDGNGNFEEQNRRVSFPGLYEIYINKVPGNEGDQYVGLYVDLFDFDDDGNLDIIVGNNHGDYDIQTEGLKIFWGNGDGTFNFNNGYTLENLYVKDYSVSSIYIPFGGAYMDIDNDGDLDIIITGQTDYSLRGWWIQIFEQVSKRKFKDVTISKLGNRNPVEFFDRTFGHAEFDYQDYAFPTIDPFVVDIDGDGDYDILPIGPVVEADWGYVDNYYFENIDGIFYERWYNDPEE